MGKKLSRKIVCLLMAILAISSFTLAAKFSNKFKYEKINMKLGSTQSIGSVLTTVDDLNLEQLKSSNPSVVRILSDGTLKAVSTGISTLSYEFENNEGEMEKIYCHIEVSQKESTFSQITTSLQNKKITITCDLGDYTTTVKCNAGAVPEIPEVTKEGYVLEGWYKEKEYITPLKERERVSKDITLYAKWVKQEDIVPIVPHSSLYDDIDEHWAKNAIESVSYRGLFQGVSPKMFGPEQTMTRAMVITVLGRLDGVEMKGRTTSFVDVPKGSYYEEYVAWGMENKIVSGVTDKEFAPNQAITREEMAVMMANYIKYKKYDYEPKETYCIDEEDISKEALESVKILNGLQIMQGNADGTYKPKKVATRAEIATIFFNYLNFMYSYEA